MSAGDDEPAGPDAAAFGSADRPLFDHAPVMLHAIDREARIMAVNEYWLQTLGYSREAVLGRRLDDLVVSAAAAADADDDKAWAARGSQHDVPCRIHCADGEILEVLASTQVVRGADGVALGGVGALVDVSARRRIEAHYRAIFDNASEGIYRSLPEGRLIEVNPALARMHGFGEPGGLVAAVADVSADWYVDPDARRRLCARLEGEGRVEGFVAECRRIASGERFWTSENVRAVRDGKGRLIHYEGTVRDITAELGANALSRARGEILELIARDQRLGDVLHEIVAAVEQQHPQLTVAVIDCREGVSEIAAAPHLAPDCRALLTERPPRALSDTMAGAMETGGTRVGERGEQGVALATAMAAGGYDAVVATPIRDQSEATLGLLVGFAARARAATPPLQELLGEMAQLAAIAFEQSRLADALVHQAHYDALTGLPNRSLLHDRLAQAISDAGRGNDTIAVLLLDLDDFKLVNDTLGHSAGDELLREVALRLQRQTRNSDTIARLGGDEFVQIARVGHVDAVSELVERLLASLQERVLIDGHEVTAHPSIGIGIYPDDGKTPEALLQCADTAMYAAKHAGKNRFRFFAATMNEQVSHRLRVETGLRRALEQGELELHYQPRVDLDHYTLLAAECLLRWPCPEGGFVPTREFLAVAERSALISAVDRYVLERAVAALAGWQAAGRDLTVSVNVSARNLREAGFARSVAGVIQRHGADPAGLELEITESMLMDDIAHAREQLAALKVRAAGIRIAIDDFGSGYSSLNYLRHLPIDTLKIDQAFVADLDDTAGDPSAAAIVRTIVEMGRNLGHNVVAEGVETGRQAKVLRTLGCHEAQGRLFAPALPFAEFAAWLR